MKVVCKKHGAHFPEEFEQAIKLPESVKRLILMRGISKFIKLAP